MKKVLGFICVGLFVLSFIGFFVIAYLANKTIIDEGEMDISNLKYFHESYEENRKQFRSLSDLFQKQYPGVEVERRVVESEMDPDLSIDTLYIPSLERSRKLLILSSGVHGIEGFTGSAVQRYFLSDVLKYKALQGINLLIIHSINPYGFKYERRVSENNIDMNRNFDVGKELFDSPNEGYGKVYNFLNPQNKVQAGYFANAFFVIKAVNYIRKFGMDTLRDATLRGQYEFQDGIFYGGTGFEPQKQWLEQLVTEKSADNEFVFLIDIHTGYGERGHLHYFPGNVSDEKRKELICRMFRDCVLDWQDQNNSIYRYTGAFREYVGELMPGDKKYIQMTFEFGTLNSQSTMGAIRSLQNMIFENQGFHCGYADENSERVVKNRFREHFYPSSKIWRSQVIEQAGDILPVLIDRYAEIQE